MNEQQNFWANDYAEDYIKKNSQFDRLLGTEVWQKMLAKTDEIESVLECGCNIGRNIGLLSEVLPMAKVSIIEISKPAFDFCTQHYEIDQAFNDSIEQVNFEKTFNLVFVMGVLIHIYPDNLLKVMHKIYDFSNKYILLGEYFNRTPMMLKYQGKEDKLFKRDFGRLFIENFSVTLVDYGFLWGHIYDSAGFDDITWWLFEKKN